MNINDVTVIVSIAKFPFAEISMFLLREYYPDVKIITAFDFSDQYSEKRKSFFSRRNIQVLPNKFHLRHGVQLDRMIKEHVETPYFITMDDDAFMKKQGLIEKCLGIIGSSFCKNIKMLGHTENCGSYLRIHPFFSLMDKETYIKNNTSFDTVKIKKEQKEIYFDTGGLLYSNYVRNNYKIININFLGEYLDHVGNSSCSFTYDYMTKQVEKKQKLKESLMKYCDGNSVPLLAESVFNENRFNKLYFDYSQLVRNKTIKKFVAMEGFNKI